MQSQTLDQKCYDFVSHATHDRDESHGVFHAEKVRNTAVAIFATIYTAAHRDEFNIVRLAAWLHDVADHKYNVSTDVVKEFLTKEYPQYTDQVLNIIENISFTKEVSKGLNVRPELLQLRNCVSDADKLEAIGRVGYERCVQFNTHKYPDHTPEQIREGIRKHADEKLLLLKDHYIHTDAGKKLAEPLHQELLEILNQK